MNPEQEELVWGRIINDIDRDLERKRMAWHVAAGFLAGFGLALLIMR